ESAVIVDQKHTVFARAEMVQKTAEDLQLPTAFEAERAFNVGHLSVGYMREVGRVRGVTIGLGGRATVNVLPQSLEPVYESRTPVGLILLMRLRPRHEGATF
ncbi:MAG TPA: hypothetical protein VJ717_19875, partial [Gemmatimonadaceae bacterium]|nr:hypothetical protein [Gemmatimonadaceae bacterium]